jgi:hypothetical protein
VLKFSNECFTLPDEFIAGPEFAVRETRRPLRYDKGECFFGDNAIVDDTTTSPTTT